MLSKIEAKLVEKNRQDDSKNKSASIPSGVQRIRRKKSARFSEPIIEEDSDTSQDTRDESTWEPSGSEDEAQQDQDSDQDPDTQGTLDPVPTGYQKTRSATNRHLNVRQKQATASLNPIVVLDSDQELNSGKDPQWEPKYSYQRQGLTQTGHRHRRRSRAKPIAIRKPICKDSDEDVQTKKNPRQPTKKCKYRGQGRPRKPDKYSSKSQAKQLPFSRYRFVGDERMNLINYAMKHGVGNAAVHFANTLGVAVSDSTVSAIVKKHLKDTTGENVGLSSVLPCNKPSQYNKYSPAEKRQIAKYCLKYGPSQTATYLARLWGIKVGVGSIRSIVERYKKSLSEVKRLKKECDSEKGSEEE